MDTRAVYHVIAFILDANGTYNMLDGYPKVFDSNTFQGDTKKARMRAESDFHATFSTMCLRDDRKLQTVSLINMNGDVEETRSIGPLTEPPEEEAEPIIPDEPEEEPENE